MPAAEPEIVRDGRLDVGHGRVARYAVSGTPTGDRWAVLFLPLGVSRSFVARRDLALAAHALGLRLLAVDRPGIGGTSEPRRPADSSYAGARAPPEASDDDDDDDEPSASRRPPAAAEGHPPPKREPPKASRTVRRRLETHSRDVALVLTALGAKPGQARVVGVCAGTPYALHFVASKRGRAVARAEHVTLVTPWVSPADCEHAWGLARVASQRWFLGRSVAGYVVASLQLGLAMPMLRSLKPAELLGLLDGKLTETERAELRAARARQAADLLSASSSSNDKSPWPRRSTATTPERAVHSTSSCSDESFDDAGADDDDHHHHHHVVLEDLELRVETTLGVKALENVAENAEAHTVRALTADVRVCLSSTEEILGAPGALAALPLRSATIFAADRDELVSPRAVEWLARRLEGSGDAAASAPSTNRRRVRVLVYRDASHTGVQTLRRDDWLRAAASDGALRPPRRDLDADLALGAPTRDVLLDDTPDLLVDDDPPLGTPLLKHGSGRRNRSPPGSRRPSATQSRLSSDASCSPIVGGGGSRIRGTIAVAPTLSKSSGGLSDDVEASGGPDAAAAPSSRVPSSSSTAFGAAIIDDFDEDDDDNNDPGFLTGSHGPAARLVARSSPVPSCTTDRSSLRPYDRPSTTSSAASATPHLVPTPPAKPRGGGFLWS